MTHERQRLQRAKLIARVRLVEQRQAIGDAAVAEIERQKLEQLAERTRTLAMDYDHRDTAQSASDLRSNNLLAGHLLELARTAAAHAEQAGRDAAARQTAAATAERRHQKAEAGRNALFRLWRDKVDAPEAVVRRSSGTHLDR